MRGRRWLGWVIWPAVLVGLGTAIDTYGIFDEARFAVARDDDLMPSTRAVPRAHLVTGQPILSVFASEADLRHPERGLLVHPMQRGREWERFAYVSYFDKATLRFATGAGLRIHGGRSRVGSVNKSFGLFFRRRYGAAPDAGLFFGPPEGGLARVVVHNDIRHDRTGRPWHFVNPLAYEIAARLGAIVPRTRPMRFFLNGQLQGVYVLTEHIGPRFFEVRFGHGDFGIEDDANPRRLFRWARALEVMDRETVSKTVDLDNLTTWALSMLFCGTTDVWQGTLARDQRTPGSRWYWINWDMDHSFMDLYQRAPRQWEIDTYRTLLGENDVRSLILTRLIQEDPTYRRHFASRVAAMLNHQLTPPFLRSRLEQYRLAAGVHGIKDTEFLDLVEQFFEHRPSILRALTRRHLSVDDAVSVTVEADAGRTIVVDGYPTKSPYRGFYFPETSISLEVPDAQRATFAGWSLHGRAAGDHWQLSLPVRSAMTVRAHFRE
ncbi:MAG TPA: CotH kinase family protein [Vicinamibacterales bacterium]|nr:CotH kinase family protein [Vicinamibacterales bacterium]